MKEVDRMIQKKIVCDRCEKIIYDSEKKQGTKASDIVDALFGISGESEVGYAEMNMVRIDGTKIRTIHLCEKCYEVAVKALNAQKDISES